MTPCFTIKRQYLFTDCRPCNNWYYNKPEKSEQVNTTRSLQQNMNIFSTEITRSIQTNNFSSLLTLSIDDSLKQPTSHQTIRWSNWGNILKQGNQKQTKEQNNTYVFHFALTNWKERRKRICKNFRIVATKRRRRLKDRRGNSFVKGAVTSFVSLYQREER